MPTGAKAPTTGLSRAVGASLREAMNARGITQAELGHAAGLSQSQTSKFLRGERALDVEQLVALCDAVGLDPASVLGQAVESSSVRRAP